MNKTRIATALALTLGLTAAHAANAALVIHYEYNGTPGTPADPDPTLDTSGNAPNTPGYLTSGVTYEAGDSRGGTGTHMSFSPVGGASAPSSGWINVGSTAGDTSALNSAAGATLFTDFRFDSHGVNNNNRLIYFSRDGNEGQARAELVINETSSGSGIYNFTAGGRADATSGGGTRDFVTSSNQAISLNQWYSIAAVFDYEDKFISIYLDGELIGSKENITVWASDLTDSSNGDVARIGRNHNTAGHVTYTGDLDNTRIYNHALTASEVAAISIPEPGSLALLALGGLAILGRHRSQRA